MKSFVHQRPTGYLLVMYSKRVIENDRKTKAYESEINRKLISPWRTHHKKIDPVSIGLGAVGIADSDNFPILIRLAFSLNPVSRINGKVCIFSGNNGSTCGAGETEK